MKSIATIQATSAPRKTGVGRERFQATHGRLTPTTMRITLDCITVSDRRLYVPGRGGKLTATAPPSPPQNTRRIDAKCHDAFQIIQRSFVVPGRISSSGTAMP